VVFPWETRETIRKIAEEQQTREAVKREVAKLVKAGLPKHLAESFLNEVLGENDCC
jgi:hypothetical protein